MSSTTINGILFKDTPEGSAGSWSVQGGREYEVTVLAITASARVGPRAVLASTGLRYGDYYRWPICSVANEWDYGSFLQSIGLAREGKDGRGWKITLKFQPYDVNHEGGANDAVSYDGKLSPFAKPPDVNWTTNKLDRSWPVDFTTSGPPDYTPAPKAYINAAGDPLEDPPKTEDSNPVVTITRFEQFWNPDLATTFKGKTNLGAWLVPDGNTLPGLTADFTGYADNTMKCLDITAKRVYDPDWGVYWEVTYAFEYRPQTWQVKLLNAGTRSLTSGKLKQIVTADGAAVSSPVCLASDGTYDPTSPPTANYLDFQPYEQVDFTAMNIPWQIFVSGATG